VYVLDGSCDCRNLRVRAEITTSPEAYRPRACDCDFCFRHGAAYVSDPAGSMQLGVEDRAELGSHRQGSGTAEFLVCRRCGVLVAVIYRADGRVFGAVNHRALDRSIRFAEPLAVSPKRLDPTQKTERWREVWFPDVRL